MLTKEETPLVDVNGVPFVQGSVFGQRKNVGLYLKITQQTKADIEYLCKVHNMSQGGLIAALVAEAVKSAAGKESD